MKYLISGGGTGGHIFPAVSIANALREADPNCDILFVGALGRMEMERVPQAGYKIIGLPIKGFDRSRPWRNIRVVIDLIRSMMQARKIVRDFHPDAGVGVGGYASGAAMKVAAKMGVPILLQEQNGFAGVTNKLLKDDAKKICVAYEGMERFFPKEKIILTGNPVRQNLLDASLTCDEAAEKMGLNPQTKTILIVGGSLGARTINESVLSQLDTIRQQEDVQFVWQTGKFYANEIAERLKVAGKPDNLHVMDFISDMAVAYAAADLVVSRAGAGSISEFCLLGKPVILVPSPNVAEDHQTKNAMALVHKSATLYVPDAEAEHTLIAEAINTVKNGKKLQGLSQNIKTLARPNAARDIAEEVIRLAKGGK